MAGMVVFSRSLSGSFMTLMFSRAAEQSEGDKAVGVDPTVITARKNNQIFRGFGLFFFFFWFD